MNNGGVMQQCFFSPFRFAIEIALCNCALQKRMHWLYMMWSVRGFQLSQAIPTKYLVQWIISCWRSTEKQLLTDNKQLVIGAIHPATRMATVEQWDINKYSQQSRVGDVTCHSCFCSLQEMNLDAQISHRSSAASTVDRMWGMPGVSHGVDNGKLQESLIWSMCYDPDNAAIGHVAMSSRTFWAQRACNSPVWSASMGTHVVLVIQYQP